MNLNHYFCNIMKKVSTFLFGFVAAMCLTACSDDEPQNIGVSDICGTWYITNIRGWEYDENSKDGKSHFSESFNFNSEGTPIGSNREEAQKVLFTEGSNTSLSLTNFYWGFNESIRIWEWFAGETGTVILQENQLINGTMRVAITKLSSTEMTTFQKNEDGETYITYTKLVTI